MFNYAAHLRFQLRIKLGQAAMHAAAGPTCSVIILSSAARPFPRERARFINPRQALRRLA